MAASWFIVVAVVSLLGLAAILAFAYPAVLAQTTAGVSRSAAITGVSFGLLVVLTFTMANVAGAIGLLGLRSWGRISAAALAGLSLLMFPVGTMAGGLIIWYMLTDEAKNAFAQPLRAVSAPRITVDLREQPSHDKPFSSSRVARMSRYRSRSANLPHLGDDAALVLRSLESLRPHG